MAANQKSTMTALSAFIIASSEIASTAGVAVIPSDIEGTVSTPAYSQIGLILVVFLILLLFAYWRAIHYRRFRS